jgi:hypothetical protein
MYVYEDTGDKTLGARLTQAGLDLLELGDTVSDHRAVAHLISVDRDDAATRAVRRKYGIARGLDVDVARRFIVAGEHAEDAARAQRKIKAGVKTLDALLRAWEERQFAEDNGHVPGSVTIVEERKTRTPSVWMPDVIYGLKIEREQAAALAAGAIEYGGGPEGLARRAVKSKRRK